MRSTYHPNTQKKTNPREFRRHRKRKQSAQTVIEPSVGRAYCAERLQRTVVVFPSGLFFFWLMGKRLERHQVKFQER